MTRYNPDIHHRRSIRLEGYDYAEAGAYFLTICTQNRECLFGEIVDGKIKLNDAGRMVDKWWKELTIKFSWVKTDEYVVMPNHFHGVIVLENHEIVNNVGARFIAPKTRSIVGPDINIAEHPRKGVINYAPTLGQIIRYFKGKTSFVGRKELPHFQWQRNYYEHVIRTEDELNRLREYIVNNPAQWSFDNENPDRLEQPVRDVGAGPCACPVNEQLQKEEGQPAALGGLPLHKTAGPPQAGTSFFRARHAVPLHINVTVYYLQPLPHFDTLNKTLNGNKNEDSC